VLSWTHCRPMSATSNPRQSQGAYGPCLFHIRGNEWQKAKLNSVHFSVERSTWWISVTMGVG